MNTGIEVDFNVSKSSIKTQDQPHDAEGHAIFGPLTVEAYFPDFTRPILQDKLPSLVDEKGEGSSTRWSEHNVALGQFQERARAKAKEILLKLTLAQLNIEASL